MKEKLLCNESRPGVELVHFKGALGYDDEEIIVSNGLSNGLRIEITNEDMDWASFHIHSKVSALLIAEKLIEWCERIGHPPSALEKGPIGANEFPTKPGSTFSDVTREDVVYYVRRHLRINPSLSRAKMVAKAMVASHGKADPVMVGEVYDAETKR